MAYTPIKGYREMNIEELALINSFKNKAEELRAMCEELRDMPGIDQRWLSIGVTDLQKGFMSVVRSIARPSTF